MSETVRRCLGCQATYPLNEHACPECGSHAGYVDEIDVEEAKQAVSSEDKRKPKQKT